MIRIGKFGVDATDRCYMVGLIARTKDKNTGDVTEYITGGNFYSTFEGTLEHIRRRMHLEAIRDTDGGLSEAIAAIRDADMRFAEMIGGIEQQKKEMHA